jgi:hypothetical protein
MDPLIEKCVMYIAEHLPEVTVLPVDLSCLAEPLLLGVAAHCTEDSLEAVNSYVRPAQLLLLPCLSRRHPRDRMAWHVIDTVARVVRFAGRAERREGHERPGGRGE